LKLDAQERNQIFALRIVLGIKDEERCNGHLVRCSLMLVGPNVVDPAIDPNWLAPSSGRQI